MRIALDAATSELSVAFWQAGRVYAQKTLSTERKHAAHIHPTIEALGKEIGMVPTQWTDIAVGCGPGSYTGTRLAVTTAKLLAWALQVPLYSVSTLEAMAYAALQRRWQAGRCAGDHWIVPMIDGRREHVYATAVRASVNAQGRVIRWECVDFERRMSWEQALALVSEGQATAVDHSIACWETEWSEPLRQRLQQAQHNGRVVVPTVPEATAIASLVELGRGVRFIGEQVHAVVPNYTQVTEAEAKWKSHHPDNDGSFEL